MRDIELTQSARKWYTVSMVQTTINSDDCWLFAGRINSYGYGVIYHQGKCTMAHRAVYEAVKGIFPKGLYSDHLCRVRRCVNPDHIEPVDNVTNVMRGNAPSAQNARKTHCPKKHPFSGDNLWIDKRGWRYCKACRVEEQKRFRAKQKS